MALDLTQLIDLEVQLHLDRDADPTELLARDRGILGADGDRAGVLALWVQERRDEYPAASPGVRFGRAARLARALFAIVGFGSGWGVAAALMHYDGTRPVNVLGWLAVAVFLQVLAVGGSVLGLVLLGVSGKRRIPVPLLGDVRALARGITRVFHDRVARHLEGDRADRLRDAMARLRSRSALYRAQESIVAFETVQWLGLAFNLGLLAGAFQLVALSDLAFAWSTTLNVGADALHGLVSALAAPWGWAFPQAVPSAELVEATRFTRFEGAFSAQSGPAISADWWYFLLASTVFYGVLPRGLLLVAGRLALRRSLRRAPLDTPEIDRLVNRLATPTVNVEPREPDDGSGRLPDAPDLPSLAPVARRGDVVRWGSFPGDDEALIGALARDLAIEGAGFHHAGGRDYREDRGTVERLAEQGADRVAVLVEAFDEPDRALRRFLSDLREALPDRVPIIVGVFEMIDQDGVVAPSRDDLKRWTSMVRAEGDAFVDVLPLGDNRE